MKKIFLLLLFFVGVTTYAENYRVEVEKLNVRSCASKDCEVIGLLKHGDVVNVESIISEESGEWGQIMINGAQGYVLIDYLTIVSSTRENGTKKSDFFKSPLFYLGIVSLIIFFILFRISYKKTIPIFVGSWDIVLLVVSAAFLAFYMLGVTGDSVEWTVSESLILILLSLIPFIVSIILTIRMPNALNVKIVSIIAKCAFVLSALVLLLIVIFLFLSSKTKKTDSLGRQTYDERGHEEWTDTRAWAKLKKYWRDMKSLSKKSKVGN